MVTPFFTLVAVFMTKDGEFYIRAKYPDCDCFHVYRMYTQDFKVYDSAAIDYRTTINLKVGATYRLHLCGGKKWYALAAQINDTGYLL